MTIIKDFKVIDQVEAKKRKRYNKNKKKAWRKKIDITDIDEKLEDERREERFGGPLEERKDDEFLFLDVGEDSAPKGVVEDSKPKEVKPVTFSIDTEPGNLSGFKQRSKKVVDKPLKSHKYLKGLPGAKSVHKAKSRQDKLNHEIKFKAKKEALRAKRNVTLEKQITKLKEMSKVFKPKVPVVSDRMVVDIKSDVWDSPTNVVEKKCEKLGIDEDFKDQIINTIGIGTRMRPVNVPGYRYMKTSALPSIMLPEAGQSYNPSFESHQVLLTKATRQALRLRRTEEKEGKALNKHFPTADKAPTKETWLEEMSEGLPKATPEEEEEEEESDEDPEKIQVSVTAKKKTERKTQQKRKKETLRKVAARKRLLAKERRMRESEVFRIKSINKEIIAEEKLRQNRAAARKGYQEQRKSKPLRLGKQKFVPEKIAVALGTELTGSLRTATSSVNIMEERFKHFQRRNVVETRLPYHARKNAAQKVVPKRAHKELLAELDKHADDFMAKQMATRIERHKNRNKL